MDRRKMLKLTGAAVAGSSLLGLDAMAAANSVEMKENSAFSAKKRKALIIGAHPDDPETGCGGTMIVLKNAGWEVVSVYLTRGEAGIEGKSHSEAAAIREKEAKEACDVMGVRPVFMSQIDGSCEVNEKFYTEMRELIDAEKPDVVFTHWPIDSHRDHRVCSTLVYDAWRRLGYCFELYYFEVMSGIQTHLFHPTDWIDITEVGELKRKACYCHESQGAVSFYESHYKMELFRGMEYRCQRAEGFVHLTWNRNYIMQEEGK